MTGLDAGQASVDVDEPADHVRVDGVIAAVEADVVVTSQPDLVDPPHLRRHCRRGGSIAALSVSSRSSSLAIIVQTSRAFGTLSQSWNWALKSPGDVKSRPGMNEVSQ